MSRKSEGKSAELRLSDLLEHDPVTIQCHDNPDADTVAAGLGLYCYFKDKGKQTRLIYSGKNKVKKANLKLMLEKLQIPLEYLVPGKNEPVEGLLITVDCQYGAGNVTPISAKQVAVIDHHSMEVIRTDRMRLQPNLGSCATLVWSMLREEGYPVDDDVKLSTALYYGLYMDTNQFAELSNPLDMDMRESLHFDKGMISLLRNSNISLKELEVAGVAMLRCNYNDDYRFAVIKSQPCDPNVLGLISDFLLQVDGIDTCVVYNDDGGGYKLSARSCIKEVNASELAAFLTEGMGSGGGHYEKAGGYISRKLYEQKYPTLHSEAYFNNRMAEYFDSFEIIYAKNRKLAVNKEKEYRRRKHPICYLSTSDLKELGSQILIRTQKGNLELSSRKERYLTLERDGSLHVMDAERFEAFLEPVQEAVPADYCDRIEYIPTVKDERDGSTHLLTDYVKVCMPKDAFHVYAKELDHCVKVFPLWDDECYMLGRVGDYLAASADNLHNIFIEPGHDFLMNFEPV